ELLDLVDQVLGRARRRAGGVDLGEDRIEGGVGGRFLRDARGGDRDVCDRHGGERGGDIGAGQPCTDEGGELGLVEDDLWPGVTYRRECGHPRRFDRGGRGRRQAAGAGE